MPFTAVLFVEKCTPSTITQFHDMISADIMSVREKWTFELKTFRNSTKSMGSDDTRVLHAITISHRSNESVIIKNKSAIITTPTFPRALYENECAFGIPDPFDVILSNQLSNMWTQRQSIKGDFGVAYRTTDLIIRMNNAFSSSGFQGMILELESVADQSYENFKRHLERVRILLQNMEILDVNVCEGRFDNDSNRDFDIIDLAFQYIKVLE